ncbi:MAG: branched-chain amino acid ABC transporter permease [Stappiaceae bacterium]
MPSEAVLTRKALVTRERLMNGALVCLLILVPLWAHLNDEPYYLGLATQVVILALAGVGLNLALGTGGMISFGHAAFFGLGGYVAGVAAYHAFDGTPFLSLGIEIPGTNSLPVIWLLSIAVAGVVALVIGCMSLRTTGVYFIMITLAFAQMIYYLAVSLPTYGGEDGLPIYLRNELPFFDSSDPLVFFGLSLTFLLCALLLVHRLTGSRFGAALQVARMNETRLATVGIPPFPIRLTGFVVSGMITGLAGALYADLNGFVGPSMLAWQRSGEIMIFVILGGVGRLFGPVVGAAVFVLLETWLGEQTHHWQFFLGLILLAVVLFARGGVMGLIAGRARHV